MSGQRHTPEFKDEAVRQVIEKGYSVGEIAHRIGVSKHSLYKWVNAVKPAQKFISKTLRKFSDYIRRINIQKRTCRLMLMLSRRSKRT